MDFPYDLTFEMDFDGECGDIASIDAHGHLDDGDVELFLADIVARETADAGWDEGPMFGFEVAHLYRHQVPFIDEEGEELPGSWQYVYTSGPHDGDIAVTRFQVSHPWTRTVDGDCVPLLCIHHPEEPAVTGIPAERFDAPDPGDVVDGRVHYCTPCLTDFEERVRTERARLLALPS